MKDMFARGVVAGGRASGQQQTGARGARGRTSVTAVYPGVGRSGALEPCEIQEAVEGSRGQVRLEVQCTSTHTHRQLLLLHTETGGVLSLLVLLAGCT